MSLVSIRRKQGRGVMIATAAGTLAVALAACSGSSSGSSTSSGTKTQTITVAVTANPLMTTIEKLTPAGFEASHPGIKVKFVTYDENTERSDVEKDVAANGGQYDVVMIGPNDIATWAKNKWISDLTADASGDASYDVNDLLPPIKAALTSDGKLYAVPFYGESSFLMYRKDMLKKAGVTMPTNPTWAEVAADAVKVKAANPGVAGICLRGLTGWGDNLASFDTVVNTFGGQWFDTSWTAHLTDPAFTEAANFYVNLIKTAGEPGAGNDSFNQCLNLMQQNKAAMWYDATVAASTIDAPGSPIQGKLGFAAAPINKTASAGWLWSWALAQEGASKHKAAAWTFMDWATSKAYIAYDAKENGWASVPPGTRASTYANPDYQKAAGDFAALTLKQIDSVNVNQPGVAPQPVPGVQYVGIPEFENFGQQVSAELTAAIDGKESVSTFLSKSQQIAQQAVVAAGYKK